MFITELMKRSGFAIALSQSTTIYEKAGKKRLKFYQTDYPVSADIVSIFSNIAQANCLNLQELYQQIHQYPEANQLMLYINNSIIWGNLVLQVIDNHNQPLLTIEPSAYGAPLCDLAPVSQEKLTFSRFVSLAREDDKVILSKPIKSHRFIVNKQLDKLIFSLFSGANIQTLLAEYPSELENNIELIVAILLGEEMLVGFEETLPNRLTEGTKTQAQWDSADLNFHASSRVGYHFGNFGGGFPFVNLIDPKPAVRELPTGKRIDLYQPDIQGLMASDASLTQLQTRRMSIRQYDEESPINLKQIGEFLYRTGRVLSTSSSEVTNIQDPTQTTQMEFAWRPYPTGGASYELEIYVTVDRAKDLAAGMYYYAPSEHQLVRISEKSIHTEALIDAAHTSCARIVRPQILLHVVARFQRVSWKYHAIAYATMLRNTGVLYQTFYLNAIAMGLAPCGLGSGNIQEFAAASQNDPLVEGNVGEFMLGSLPKNFKLEDLNENIIAQMHGAVLAGAGK